MIQIAARLVSAHQFDTDARTHSNSGSDRVFSRDIHNRATTVSTGKHGHGGSLELNMQATLLR